jgi:NAD(P)H-dependent flavin oxidoreductase YrpB (nitropropane dioxygenase family)
MAWDDEWETPFTALVGCRLPVQMAVLGGGVGSVALAAAVSECGGLGMLPQWAPSPIPDRLAAMRGLVGSRPFGMGFFAFDVAAHGAVFDEVARSVRVVDVFWGEPDAALVARIHDGGALAFWQVGSTAEALAAAAAGCDAVVAQGVEAGGHVRGSTPLLQLLPAVVAAVDMPVIAAGGISTGAAMADALRAGAAAVRVGTRLVATAESDAHPAYVEALLAAGQDSTVLGTAYHVGWEDAPHRVLRSCVETAAAGSADVVGSGQYGALQWDVPRWFVGPPLRCMSGDVAGMAMYAGAGVADVSDAPPARIVLERMVSQARELLA